MTSVWKRRERERVGGDHGYIERTKLVGVWICGILCQTKRKQYNTVVFVTLGPICLYQGEKYDNNVISF